MHVNTKCSYKVGVDVDLNLDVNVDVDFRWNRETNEETIIVQ